MKRARKALWLLPVLLLAASRLCGRDDVIRERVQAPAGSWEYYTPAHAAPTETPHGDWEFYEPALSLPRRMTGAVLLSRPGDGGRELCRELARRGTAAVLLRDETALPAAWEWLRQREAVDSCGLGLLARGDAAVTALRLAESLAGEDSAPAAVVLLGEAGAETDAVRNLLRLCAASETEKTAGFFADGTARRVQAVGSRLPRYDRRSVMLSVIDWLGSALGHCIPLPDEDLQAGLRGALRVTGLLLLLPAALWGFWPPRRKGTKE